MILFLLSFAAAVPEFYMQSMLDFLTQIEVNFDQLTREDKLRQAVSQIETYFNVWRIEKPADFLAERSEWMKDNQSAELVCRMVRYGVVNDRHFNCMKSVSEVAGETVRQFGGLSEILRFTAR